MLTHACNLACSYCYTGDKKRVRMTEAVAARALEAAFARAGRTLQLTFFGGEPLLEPELLCGIAGEARRRAAERDVALTLQVTTNGTRLDDALLARLIELDVYVALSLDGTRAAHEIGRPSAGGGSSYAAVRAALARLLAAGRPFDVIMVVDPDNVAHLGEGVRELFDLGVPSITLNPNWGAAWTDETLAAWQIGYELAAAVALAWWRRGRRVVLQPLAGAMTTLARGRDLASTCGAGQTSFAVAPSGRVYPCARSVGEDEKRGAIGHIDGWASTDGARAGANRRSECGGCPSHARCERHCACACSEETGDPFTPGPILCWHQHLIETLAARLSRASTASTAA